MLLRNWDAAASRAEPRALHDFLVWREALTSVDELGAYRDVARNLIVARRRRPRRPQVAEISASAFRVAPAQPLLGRVLGAGDERAGAPPVVCSATTCGGRASRATRTWWAGPCSSGDTYATVVGVMPEGFGFPVSHEVWTPLRPDALDQTPRGGPGITVFGRLAPGATLEAAQAELTTLGTARRGDLPATHEHLQPQVGRYAEHSTESRRPSTRRCCSINVFASCCSSWSAATSRCCCSRAPRRARASSIVRSALGASRGRIVVQLFAEALVLGGVAAAVGLAAARFALERWGVEFLEVNIGAAAVLVQPRPVARRRCCTPSGSTVLGAAIAGVCPALKVTRGLGARLRQGTAGGGLRFGGVWTAVIVAQVAVTVAFPGHRHGRAAGAVRIRSSDAGFAAEEYLAARIDVDAPAESRRQRDSASASCAALDALRQRLAAEPGVAGVTFADRLPRHGPSRLQHRRSSCRAAPRIRTPAARGGIASDRSRVLRRARSADPRGPRVQHRRSHARCADRDRRPGLRRPGAGGRNAIGRRVRFSAEPRPRAARWSSRALVRDRRRREGARHGQRRRAAGARRDSTCRPDRRRSESR